jgi:biotin carboxyl carrier protein
VRFGANPVVFLRELYHYLDMDTTELKPASEMIWQDDQALLSEALDFYAEVEQRSGQRDWAATEKLFRARSNRDIAPGDAALWKQCVAAHRGFQAGLELLLLIPRLGMRAGFNDVSVSKSLEPVFPDRFTDPNSSAELARGLAPPPKARSNEIVAPSGGAFFAREAPHLPILIDEGDHFEAGQPLFIIEVMKMFNKVLAPFAGTVVENRMQDADGTIVSAGQTLYRIEPDEVVVEESQEVVRERRRNVTLSLLG